MIIDALTGWLGLVTVVVAACCALAADYVRQGAGPASSPGRGRRRWTRGLTGAAVVLALLAAVATVVRFVVLT